MRHPPKLTHAGHTTTLLTYTSTMDCYSWSIPAGAPSLGGSCPAELVDEPNAICNGCYAKHGRYRFPLVKKAQATRLAFAKSSLFLDHGMRLFETLHSAIYNLHSPYFRVHDSGDFFSLPYLQVWHDIAEALPRTKFWFPTRTHAFPHWSQPLAALAALPNCTVRPSSTHVGNRPPIHPFLHAGTTVSPPQKGTKTCPKTINHTSCATEGCRSCWTAKATAINYLPHGSLTTFTPLTTTARTQHA